MTEPSAPESARDIIVKQAVEELAPDKSLERLTATARFLLGTSGLIGGVLTGYGALASDQVSDHKVLGGAAVVAVALSFMCAAWSLVGASTSLNLENEDEVLEFLGDEIKDRRPFVIAAGVLFALALPLSALTALLPEKQDNPPAALSVAFGTGDPDLVIDGDAGKPGRGTIVELTVTGPSKEVLASGHFEAQRDGELRYHLEAEIPSKIDTLTVRAEAEKAGRPFEQPVEHEVER